MQVLICDDEPLARERLRRMLEKIDGVSCVGDAVNGVDLLKKVEQLSPDIVVTDIRMPGMDGLEAASHLARCHNPPAVIFCTAYDDHAVHAFQVNAIGYLLKPVKLQDLERALWQAKRITRAQLTTLQDEAAQDAATKKPSREFISARTHRGIELIRISDIRYFMADQKYVTVRHGHGEVLIDDTLKQLESMLGEHFFRIHRNCLINLAYLDSLGQQDGQVVVHLRDVAEPLMVSRRLVASLKKAISER